MVNALENLSRMTTIKRQGLDTLFRYIESIIAHETYKARNNGLESVSVNIGLGELLISLESDSVVYKFTPSQTLSEKVLASVDKGKDPLEDIIDAALVKRLISTYKDLM